jgi:hypothetical protein
MNQLDEQSIKRSIIGILNSKSNIIGTGFYISEDGYAISCYHVIESLERIEILDFSGNKYPATLDSSNSIKDADIAVLKISVNTKDFLKPSLSFNIGDQVWTSGYQFYGMVIQKPLPTIGTIEGTTQVSFGVKTIYTLNNIIKIGGATIAQGISGGPVLLTNSLKVIGLTNAKFSEPGGGGFSMPFSEAITKSASFKQFINDLSQTYLKNIQKEKDELSGNAFASQLENALTRLIKNEQYLPGKIVERKLVSEHIDNFFNGNLKIFALVGNSGVGKTNFLASLGEKLRGKFAIFLSAYQFELPVEGLKGEIQREFGLMLDQENEMRITTAELMNVFNVPENKSFIIIDALNEAPDPVGSKMKTWIDRTIAWVKNRNIKIILSSRTEFWEKFESDFPKALLYSNEKNIPDPKPRIDISGKIILNDFTDDEFRRAISCYNLPPEIYEKYTRRHPLLIRMIWTLRSQLRDTKKLGNYSLYSFYINEKCKFIAKNTNHSVDSVFSKLLLVAKKLKEKKELSMGLPEYFSLFHESEIPDAFISENILTPSQTVIRFGFDQLAEFLISQTVEVEGSSTEWESLIDENNWFDSAIIPWQIAKLENDGRNIHVPLEIIAKKNRKRVGHPNLLAYFNNTLLVCSSSEDYLTIAENLYRDLSLNKRDDIVEFKLAELINNINVDFHLLIQLVKICLWHQEYYNWELKHWEELTFDEFISDNFSSVYGIMNLFKQKILSDHEFLFTKFEEWLADPSPLSSGYELSSKARIRDIAGALLFHFRFLDFQRACDILVNAAEKQSNIASRVLSLIAKNDRMKLSEVIRKWHADAQHGLMIGRLSFLILDPPDHELAVQMYPLLQEEWENAKDIEVKMADGLALLKIGRNQPEIIASILNHIQTVSDSIYQLDKYYAEFFEPISAALDQIICKTNSGNLKDKFIDFLFSNKVALEHENKLAVLLKKYVDLFLKTPDLHYRLAAAYEMFTNRLTLDGEAYKEMLEYFKQIVRILEPKHQSPLYYFLNGLSYAQRKEDRINLIEWIIEQPESISKLHLLSELLIKNAMPSLDRDTAFNILKKILLKAKDRRVTLSSILELSISRNEKGIQVLTDILNDGDLHGIGEVKQIYREIMINKLPLNIAIQNVIRNQ